LCFGREIIISHDSIFDGLLNYFEHPLSKSSPTTIFGKLVSWR